MTPHISRRDLLRLTALLPLGYALPRTLETLGAADLTNEPPRNVIVVVCDALSAANVALHGYQRHTMPNLTRLAQRAIVYHNHFAGGNYTTPGTATLLTGTLPWTHRAFLQGGTVAKPFVEQSIFSAFRNHYRIAYTHNAWADIFLRQFRSELDEYVSPFRLYLRHYDGFIYDRLIQELFANDTDIASVSWTRNVKIGEEGYAYSLFLSHVYQAIQQNRDADLKRLFPLGLPTASYANSEFLLETAVDWIGNRLSIIPQPFIGYFHFLPPHQPYHTRRDFFGKFSGDGMSAIEKPQSPRAKEPLPREALFEKRTEYDEFLLYADENFGRLYDILEASGLLENTWLVLTSDHGEMFERGIAGHRTSTLYQPVIRIPLLIFEPGRTSGMNIYAHTSAIDVLPTLAHVARQPIPAWTEGVVMPPFAEPPSVDRAIYALWANENDQDAPITRASVMMLKQNYKLIYYLDERGPEVQDPFELYDVSADPEELTDLRVSQRSIATALLNDLTTKMAEVNQPYL